MPNARTVLTWPTIISQSMVSSAFGLVKGPAGNPQKVGEGRLLLGREGNMWEGVEERVRSRNNVGGIDSKFSSDGYGISHKNLLLVDWCHNQGQEGAATVTGRGHLTGAVIDRGPGAQITGRLHPPCHGRVSSFPNVSLHILPGPTVPRGPRGIQPVD